MKRLSITIAVLATAALVAAGPASAADRYAEPNGDGPSTLCLQSDPCSLTGALNDFDLSHGDNVILAKGNYTQTTGILINKAINVYGTGTASETRITATDPLNYAISSAGAWEVTLSNFELITANPWGGLVLSEGDFVRGLIVRNSGSDACIGTSATVIGTLCVSTANNGIGYRSSANGLTSELVFRNSTFVGGPSGYGMYAISSSSTTSNIDSSSTIFSGGLLSVYLGSEAGSTLTFTADHSNIVNLVPSGPGVTVPAVPGAGANQSAAPIFKNAAAGDYSMAAGSPTIDAGAVGLLSLTTDLGGLARTQGAAPDIGAYEFTPVAATPPVVTDTTKPKVTITKKPKSKTTSRKLNVRFKADETAKFSCKLDKAKFKSCKSPYKKTVKLGKHKLQIKATDAAGNVSSVKTIKWTVRAR